MASISTSPLSTPPPSSTPISASHPPQTPLAPLALRPTIPVPFPLENQITIYFEENLYTQALNLLSSLVSASAHTPPTHASYAPCPAHLALASTLIVHPALTTRSRNPEDWVHADAALRFLRVVQGVLGAGAGWARALRFGERGRRERERERQAEEDGGGGGCGGGERVENRFANEGSLYVCGEDVWHVLGWGFNCAVVHGKRWARWVVWMEWMVGVLETEWRTCVARKEGLLQSLVWTYAGGGLAAYGGGIRRMLRAVFAIGNKKDLNEFPEVFRHELQEPKVEDQPKTSRKEVDVDRGLYPDYMVADDQELDQLEARSTRGKRISQYNLRTASRKASRESLNSINNEEDPGEDGPAYFGGMESLRLRLRLLQLLSDVAVQIPREFMDAEALHSHYVDFIRHLPLATFHAIVSPAAGPDVISVDLQTALCENLLWGPLLEGGAPSADGKLLTQSKLEECYLPYAAGSSSVVENAKVSLCIETLLRHLLAAGQITARESLKSAIERGRERRCSKATEGVSRGAAAERRKEAAWPHLLESGERMRDIWRRLGLIEKVTFKRG